MNVPFDSQIPGEELTVDELCAALYKRSIIDSGKEIINDTGDIAVYTQNWVVRLFAKNYDFSLLGRLSEPVEIK